MMCMEASAAGIRTPFTRYPQPDTSRTQPEYAYPGTRVGLLTRTRTFVAVRRGAQTRTRSPSRRDRDSDAGRAYY
eukprot:3659996-Rhodomonas_salina.1